MSQLSEIGARRILVTGGAGVIGSALVKELLEEGFAVTVLDNLRTGSLENLPRVNSKAGLKFIRADLCEPSTYSSQIRDCNVIFHLATLRKWPEKNDYHATLGLTRALRYTKVKFLLMHSTALVYGNASVVPTPECYSPLEPKMAYEVNKLKCERLITNFAAKKKIPAAILRFALVTSGNSYHGVARDYFERLLVDPTKLRILGDGLQRRSYVLVDDCVSAIKTVAKSSHDGVEVYNVASKDAIDLHKVLKAVTEEMDIELPQITHTGAVSEGGGWPGDPRILFPDTTKLQRLGWSAHHNSVAAIRRSVGRMLRRSALNSHSISHFNPKESAITLRILEKSHWDRESAKHNGNQVVC